MKIAIMQPYFMPYIGYFQMINAVDKFVFYDDVNFIKRGWINRNNILNKDKGFLFTFPLKKASQNALINETYLNLDNFDIWKKNFFQTLSQNYRKAFYYESTYQMLQKILNNDYKTISELAIGSLKEISKHLHIDTEFITASERYSNMGMNRQERLIDICKQEICYHYINAIGGSELYKKEDFAKEGIRLDFIQSRPIEYKQFKNEFVPWLSIIDVLMFNSIEEIKLMLDQYELV